MYYILPFTSNIHIIINNNYKDTKLLALIPLLWLPFSPMTGVIIQLTGGMVSVAKAYSNKNKYYLPNKRTKLDYYINNFVYWPIMMTKKN